MSPLGGYLSDGWGSVTMILIVCFLAGSIIYLLNLVSSPYFTAILFYPLERSFILVGLFRKHLLSGRLPHQTALQSWGPTILTVWKAAVS